MESIILNLLNLTGEERAAFAVLAPQRFHPDGAGLTVEDWQSAQVILGNPPPGFRPFHAAIQGCCTYFIFVLFS